MTLVILKLAFGQVLFYDSRGWMLRLLSDATFVVGGYVRTFVVGGYVCCRRLRLFSEACRTYLACNVDGPASLT